MFAEYLRELHELDPDRSGNLLALREVGSTNALARRIFLECAGEGVSVGPTWIVAHGQSEGRGRQGRDWVSPVGAGLYATLLFPLSESGEDPSPESLASLPLRVAAALCEQLDGLLGEAECRLKWPNDLMVDGAKLGGILIEIASHEDEGRVGLIGFGINHSDEGLETVERSATSLSQLLEEPPSLARLTVELLRAVDESLASVEAAQAIEQYRRWSLHAEGDLLRHRSDTEEVEGLFRGFDAHGFLRLEVDGKERLLSAGEVERS